MQLMTVGCSPYFVATSTPSSTCVPSCSCVSTLPMSCNSAPRPPPAPHWTEARPPPLVRRVVDDAVHPVRRLERADVPPFAPDDAPLHLIGGEGDRGPRSLGGGLGGEPLDRQGKDLLCLF